MNKLPPQPTDKCICVLVVAAQELVRQALKVLISSTRDLSVAGTVPFTGEYSNPKEALASDVAVIYHSAGDKIDVISRILDVAPHLRIVAVTDRDDLDTQASAIKLGAVGIVNKEQNPKVLVEAIRQTNKGETWFNQVVLNKILVNERAGKNKSSNSDSVKTAQSLTPRELEVTRMIGDGLKNKEIALKLAITEATVRHHLSSIYGKIGVEDRLNLVITAYQRGLIDLPKKDRLQE